MNYRDAGCYDCIRSTAGDCGQHGPRLYPSGLPVSTLCGELEEAKRRAEKAEASLFALQEQIKGLEAKWNEREQLYKKAFAEAGQTDATFGLAMQLSTLQICRRDLLAALHPKEHT